MNVRVVNQDHSNELHVQNSDILTFNFSDYLKLFDEHGGTDKKYLEQHFLRFQNTYLRFISSWDQSGTQTVVDIGAHWLHQALIYSLAGFQVEAFNLNTTFKKEKVQSLAKAYNIKLTVAEDLQWGECFQNIPESSVDLVLFTEIIEHLAFNPVALWESIYRIMKPGGRIVVTTPNYYSLTGRSWDLKRFLKGSGGGVSVEEVLMRNTYGHHWKEFSMKEITQYFLLLSPDFSCVKSEYTDDRNHWNKTGRAWKEFLINHLDFLKPNLHVEVELTRKDRGISVKPAWS